MRQSQCFGAFDIKPTIKLAIAPDLILIVSSSLPLEAKAVN
jgi:hypothetical protein